MRTRFRTAAFAVILVIALTALGGCGDDDSGQDQGGTATTADAAPEETADETTAPEGEVVSREEVVTCLDEAGLSPTDSGLFIIGSAGTDVEAIAVSGVAQGVLLFVFDHDAADEVEYIDEVLLTGVNYPIHDEVTSSGNVVVAYRAAPADDERTQIEACLTGA
jgi:hypothetical protein